VSHRNNSPGSKCPGFSSITALVSKCLVPRFLVLKCLETGAEVSQGVLMPKCLVAEVSGNPVCCTAGPVVRHRGKWMAA